MPARQFYAAMLSGAAFLAIAPAAFAGCNINNGPCAPGVNYTSAPYRTAPINVHYGQPFEHLSSVTYKQTPNVNVLRVQTGADYAALDQAPGAYWQDCKNSSGAPVAYCGGGQSAGRFGPAPAMPMPRPAPSAMSGSFMSGASVQGFDLGHTSRSGYTGGPVVNTPGHAYVSHNTIVHRMPAQWGQSQYSSSSYSPSGQSATSSGGWRQVSGPTVVDGMLATQVICKDPAPAPVVQKQAYQVVRPVIAVRYPVVIPRPAGQPLCAAPKKVDKFFGRGGGRY